MRSSTPVAIPYVECRDADTRARVANAASEGCYCGAVGGKVVRRTQRNNVTVVTVQCDGCGRSLTGALKREHFPFYLDLTSWDDTRRDRFYAQESAEGKAYLERREAERQASLETRRADYAAFRSSREWLQLRDKVRARARFRCEACGDGPAEHVHHLTYEFGVAPPLWVLRAVCHPCHGRLHRAGDPWHQPHLPTSA